MHQLWSREGAAPPGLLFPDLSVHHRKGEQVSEMEGSVFEVLTSKFGEPIARMILEKLKAEWLAEKEEKDDCDHRFWRFVWDGEHQTKCDLCGAYEVAG